MASGINVSPQTVFRLSAEGTTGEVRLDPDAWRVLAQVNGARTVSEIAANLSADPSAIAHVAGTLCQLGLLAVEDHTGRAAQATVGASFFEKIEREFVQVIGPIGPILLDEEIAKLGADRNNFARDQVAELVERVSAQVNDQAKRIKFQKIMLDAIRQI